jgi:hypothetical protein
MKSNILTIKRKKSKKHKEKEGATAKSTMMRGDSFNEAVTQGVIKRLKKQPSMSFRSSSTTTQESPRNPALPTPA